MRVIADPTSLSLGARTSRGTNIVRLTRVAALKHAEGRTLSHSAAVPAVTAVSTSFWVKISVPRSTSSTAMKSPGVSRMSRTPRRPVIRPTRQSTNHDPPIRTRDVTAERGPSTSIRQGR